ncbi:MAG TPA: hypothetical protein VF366_09440 [Dehalococcoidia bacterium]|jgi:predicted N-acetyltransferase YhbS
MDGTSKVEHVRIQIIRPETAEDAAAIRRINEEAFGQPEEAELIEKL